MMLRKMHFLSIVFTALFCFELKIMSKAQTVLTIDSTSINGKSIADFDVSMFNKFYSCLCDGSKSSCTATTGDDDNVMEVEVCPGGSSTATVKTYNCETFQKIACIKLGSSGEQDNCEPQSVENKFCGIITLQWSGNQQVDANSFSDNITLSRCDYGNCHYISATHPVTPSRPLQTTPAPTPRSTQPSSLITRQDGATDAMDKDDDNDNNDMTIIIGAAIGGAVFVVIVVIIIIIILRRRRQKASSSLTTTTTTTTSSNKNDDTDIYPYADSSMGNVGPNLTFNNLNSNNPTSVTYATVDPSKKLTKKKTSLGTNNVNDNKEDNSKDNKTQCRPNLGYTEVDLNNDADFPQSSSDANKGQMAHSSSQVLPPPPPDPSVKPKYYNTFGGTEEDPSAAYAQVVKKNKNKDESPTKGEEAGSNPIRDPSGYEEAVHRTDTQYAEVDLSAKTKTKLNPAPGGVYAKLHDPVRKITDVYNECPVADNAGE